MYDPNENVRIDLDDRIWGIEGTYCGKEKVDGVGHDEELYYIKYRPAIDLSQVSLVKRLMVKLGLADFVEQTPEPIPDSQFQKVPNPHAGSVPGVPDKKVVLMNNKNGESPWNEYIGEAVGRELQRVMSEKEKQERENLLQEAEKFGKEHQGKLEEDKNRRRRPKNNEENDSTKVTGNGSRNRS
jgi:hypothetical protein